VSTTDNLLGTLIRDLGGTVLAEVVGRVVSPSLAPLARQATGMIADALGVPGGANASPAAVAAAAQANPEAARAAVQATEQALAPEIARVALIEAERASKAQDAEIEKGFGSWQMRRDITTYSLLAMFLTGFVATGAVALGLLRGDVAVLSSLVTTAATAWGAFQITLSGGRALTDFARARNGQG
jgi:hypothetical protein